MVYISVPSNFRSDFPPPHDCMQVTACIGSQEPPSLVIPRELTLYFLGSCHRNIVQECTMLKHQVNNVFMSKSIPSPKGILLVNTNTTVGPFIMGQTRHWMSFYSQYTFYY